MIRRARYPKQLMLLSERELQRLDRMAQMWAKKAERKMRQLKRVA